MTLSGKDLPSPLYIIPSSALCEMCSASVTAAPHPAAPVQCSHNAKLKSSGPSLLMRCGPCEVWWGGGWGGKANMVGLNGRVPASHCANAITASQYARLGKTDIFSLYIWMTEMAPREIASISVALTWIIMLLSGLDTLYAVVESGALLFRWKGTISLHYRKKTTKSHILMQTLCPFTIPGG